MPIRDASGAIPSCRDAFRLASAGAKGSICPKGQHYGDQGVCMMSNLIVVAYPGEYRAAEVLASLRRSSNECLIDLEDACYVIKDASGR
jgi:hypothetical protein